MHLALPIALVLSAPAAAQDVVGACVMDLMWSAEGDTARLSGCTAPAEEPLLTLMCGPEGVVAEAVIPLAPAPGEPAEVVLMVDGRRQTLGGMSDVLGAAGADMIAGLALSDRTVERLAAGRNGLLTSGSAVLPFHLTGSRAAISAMRSSCR